MCFFFIICQVDHFWKERGVAGFIVSKYRLKQIKGQPKLVTHQVILFFFSLGFFVYKSQPELELYIVIQDQCVSILIYCYGIILCYTWLGGYCGYIENSFGRRL